MVSAKRRVGYNQSHIQQDAPLMALHGMLNVAPIIPHCMFRRYLKNILPWPLK